MIDTLKIEIKAGSENRMHLILQHIVREIMEGKKYNNPAISEHYVEEGWLVLPQKPLKGKYRWSKT